MPLVDVILDNFAVASFLCASVAELETMVWNAFRSVLTIDNDGPIGFRVLRKDDGRGNETRFTSSSSTNGKELMLLADSDFATMPSDGEWTVVLERHVTSTPTPVVRKGGNQIDVERDEATRRDAERAEAARREAERAEAARREAERAEAARRDAERAEAARREAERAAATRREAERAEAARREAERAEAARRDAERAEAARREAEREARREADRFATARLEAERAEALRRASADASPPSSIAASSSSDRTPSKVKSSRVPSSTAAESPSAETSSPARPKQRVPSSSSTSSSLPETAGASAVPLRNTNTYISNQATLRSQSGTMPVSSTMISECATYVELRIRIVETETSSSSAAAAGGGGGATTPQGYLHVFEQTADGSLEWVDCDERYQAARTRRATFVYRWDASPILAGNDTTTAAATQSSLSGTSPLPPVGIQRGSSDRGGAAAYIDPLQQRYNNNNNSAPTSSSSIAPSLDGFSGVYHVDTIQAAKWRGSLRVLNRRNSSVFSVPFNIRCPPSYWMLLQQIASHMSVPERYLDLSFVCDDVDHVISICSDRDVMAMVTLLGQPNPIVHAVDVRV